MEWNAIFELIDPKLLVVVAVGYSGMYSSRPRKYRTGSLFM